MQDAPTVVFEALFCQNCCCKQPVHSDGQAYICSLCRSVVQPLPDDQTLCPRSALGHNAFSTPTGWVCSRCNAPMPWVVSQ